MLRGHQSIFEFINSIWPLREGGGPTQCRFKNWKILKSKITSSIEKMNVEPCFFLSF